MRKWMRERLKRRKKQTEQAAAEAPPPLQPTFYDIQPESTSPAEVKEPEPESAASAQERPAPVQPQRSGEARRRRRRRGGRGRGGSGASGQQVAAASSGPTTTGMDTTEPGVSAEVGLPEHGDGVASEVVAPQVPTPPASRGTVVLAIGLPGSGKSSWFKRHNISPLSSDLLRVLLFDDAGEQRFQDLIFSNLRSMLKARLIARRPMNYVDATNLTAHDRQAWIKLAKDYGYDVQAVFFDVPVEVCLERNRKRERVVPEDVMRRVAAKLKPPRFEEGFSKITVVRVKRKTGDG
ncbi:MAG TPA: AAA family ATPase [Terriglobales bacterium]|nr:AAA family ATPase [Terriglobales bacterium]